MVEPQPGPQEMFAACTADIAFYGGSAGSGKSWALCFDAVRWYEVPGYDAVIFRRESTQIQGGGSIWDESTSLYPSLGGVSRESPAMEWRFPSGARVEFRHLQREADKHAHQSKQYAYIGFDEVTQFSETQFWYLYSRARSTCGVRPCVRGTCNPDPDSFVARLIAWWLDEDGYAIPERAGVVRWFVRDNDTMVWADTAEELREDYPEAGDPQSFTFIPAKLSDNQKLVAKDPGYESRLKALPLIERMRLLGANWKVRAAAGMFFQRSWFEVVDAIPGRLLKTVRAWDKAATKPSPQNPDPDWTRGVKMGTLEGPEPRKRIILHVESLRDTPGKVEDAMARMAAQDGREVTIAAFQDPGQAGKVDVHHMRQSKGLDGYKLVFKRPTVDKVTAAGPLSSRAEHGRVLLLRGPWNEAFLAEAEAFDGSGKGHDDQIDGAGLADSVLDGGGVSDLGGFDADAGHRPRDSA